LAEANVKVSQLDDGTLLRGLSPAGESGDDPLFHQLLKRQGKLTDRFQVGANLTQVRYELRLLSREGWLGLL